MLLLVMAYRLLREFRQASTRLDTPPFSKPSSPILRHSSQKAAGAAKTAALQRNETIVKRLAGLVAAMGPKLA